MSGRRLTAAETAQAASVQLGLRLREGGGRKGTLRSELSSACAELAIETGWKMQAGTETCCSASKPTAGSVDSLELAKLRADAQVAVGSYAKAAATKLKQDRSAMAAASGTASTTRLKGNALADRTGNDGTYTPQVVSAMSEALDRAVVSERPVFLTARPAEPGSFAFRGSYIVPHTRVLTKHPSVRGLSGDCKQAAINTTGDP
eukprot:SAG31_NODE_4512_length_3176_cov_2.548261_1_plen_204_part_00